MYLQSIVGVVFTVLPVLRNCHKSLPPVVVLSSPAVSRGHPLLRMYSYIVVIVGTPPSVPFLKP